MYVRSVTFYHHKTVVQTAGNCGKPRKTGENRRKLQRAQFNKNSSARPQPHQHLLVSTYHRMSSWDTQFCVPGRQILAVDGYVFLRIYRYRSKLFKRFLVRFHLRDAIVSTWGTIAHYGRFHLIARHLYIEIRDIK